MLIIDGLNPYHEWQVTTPLMKQILEDSGRFTVDVATVPIPEDYKASTNAPPPTIDRPGVPAEVLRLRRGDRQLRRTALAGGNGARVCGVSSPAAAGSSRSIRPTMRFPIGLSTTA